jgi:hypothetical protein
LFNLLRNSKKTSPRLISKKQLRGMGVMDEAEPVKKTMLRVRGFDVERDLRAVEELERLCQVGLSGDQGSDPVADLDGGAKKTRSSKKKKGMSLYVEQIGDPFARVRHATDNVMLVILLYHTPQNAPQPPPLTLQFDLVCLRHDSDAHECA